MTRTGVKLLVGGLALAGAVAFLAVAGAKEGWVYYLPVDQYVTGADYHSQRVRLHGNVSPDDLQVNRGLLLAEFDLVGETRQVRISYSGAIPDMFQADREVVVEGQMDEAGVFRADTLLTKCASKYEADADAGDAPHADPRAADAE